MQCYCGCGGWQPQELLNCELKLVFPFRFVFLILILFFFVLGIYFEMWVFSFGSVFVIMWGYGRWALCTSDGLEDNGKVKEKGDSRSSSVSSTKEPQNAYKMGFSFALVGVLVSNFVFMFTCFNLCLGMSRGKKTKWEIWYLLWFFLKSSNWRKAHNKEKKKTFVCFISLFHV